MVQWSRHMQFGLVGMGLVDSFYRSMCVCLKCLKKFLYSLLTKGAKKGGLEKD